MNIVSRLLGRKKKQRFTFEYSGDGFAVRGKNLGFLHEPSFAAAYEWSALGEFAGRKSAWAGVDLRWRSHICLWAARNGLSLEGDFVECGVDTAVFSGVIVKCLRFEKVKKDFFLFDTFEGIPQVDGMNEREAFFRKHLNETAYFDSYGFVEEKMRDYPNVTLVKGVLPDTLERLGGRKIAYLSVDLNNAPSEKAVMDILWDRLAIGAITVIDDYAFADHDAQYQMWNEFAAQRDLSVASLPTGQGLLIKTRA